MLAAAQILELLFSDRTPLVEGPGVRAKEAVGLGIAGH